MWDTNIVYTTYVCMYLPRLGMVCVAYGVEGVLALLCWCRWVLCWAMRLRPDCHKSHKAVLGYCLYVRYCDTHGYVWELCEEEVGSCEVDLPPLLAVYKRHRTMNNFSLPLSLCKWVSSTCLLQSLLSQTRTYVHTYCSQSLWQCMYCELNNCGFDALFLSPSVILHQAEASGDFCSYACTHSSGAYPLPWVKDVLQSDCLVCTLSMVAVIGSSIINNVQLPDYVSVSNTNSHIPKCEVI